MKEIDSSQAVLKTTGAGFDVQMDEPFETLASDVIVPCDVEKPVLHGSDSEDFSHVRINEVDCIPENHADFDNTLPAGFILVHDEPSVSAQSEDVMFTTNGVDPDTDYSHVAVDEVDYIPGAQKAFVRIITGGAGFFRETPFTKIQSESADNAIDDVEEELLSEEQQRLLKLINAKPGFLPSEAKLAML